MPAGDKGHPRDNAQEFPHAKTDRPEEQGSLGTLRTFQARFFQAAKMSDRLRREAVGGLDRTSRPTSWKPPPPRNFQGRFLFAGAHVAHGCMF